MTGYGLWLSAAGMKVSEHRQTLLANNLANVETTGFKHDLAVIMQRQVESRESPGGFPYAHPVLDGLSGGVNVRPAHYSQAQGPIERTGRPLDIAIRGEGFFPVGDGEVTRYTRNGEFAVNTLGELIMANDSGRWRVLDAGGAPIVIDPAGGELKVSQSGTFRQGDEVIGILAPVINEDPRAMRKVGENLFESTGGEMVPAGGSFVPGSRERSTFNAMEGLAAMIEASRAYQLNATMIQLQDQVTGQAVSTLGRVA